MSSFTGFFSNTIVIDKTLWQIWLMGLTVDNAINVALVQHRKRAAAAGALRPEQNQVAHFVTTQYRNFEIIEGFLHQPRQLSSQPLFPMPQSTKQFLIESYYGFDERVIRELLGKKLTSRVRKELEEVCSRTRVHIISCRRMFDNLKRIIKRVEDADAEMVSVIQREFLLPQDLAQQYANIIFINNYRFDTTKKRIAHLRFSDFVYVASIFMTHFTASTKTVLEELDASLAQDSRDLRALLFNSKETLEQLRVATAAQLASLGQQHILERAGASAFKVLLRNIMSIGAGLINNREIRDLFATIQEKVVDPCIAFPWSAADMSLFLDTVMAQFCGIGPAGLIESEVVNAQTRKRYSGAFARLVTAIKLAGMRLHAAAVGTQ
ncbi:hypothetical protein HK105_203026 [Polyrhizophydium stewartii]|uniref:Acidic fibroblast growth factor intracellular-binding protein n=1 Tax=Polyrhizophydium stewartii TaxID=2732419 RepID=A0ABR4NCV0_9FUNG|nr:hypothetical protein HK105_008043 [Polyrhizophydium stewartii]